jgi:hypothetical protein
MNHRNFTISRNITLFCVLYFILSLKSLFSQETGVMPTQVPGSNSVSVFYKPYSNSCTYSFYHNGNLRYDYTILNADCWEIMGHYENHQGITRRNV